jgi:glucose uptake protein GlcU
LLFLLGTGGLVFALQVALTVMVPLLAAVSLIVSTALLLSGVAWAIWALADMGQTREMRSVALAVATAAFPLVTGALLSLYGALLTLIVIILADG